MIEQKVGIHELGAIGLDSGLIPIDESSDGISRVGQDGVISIAATGDRKVELIAYTDHTLAHVASVLGYPACNPTG